MELKDVTCRHFAEHVGEMFRLSVEGGQNVELELTEAKPTGGGTTGDAFAVLFRGPVSPVLEQRIYEVVHPDLGTLPIFMVPVSQQAGGIFYEAVFTRLE